MKNLSVKDVMIQISEYTTVPENSSLFEAVLELEKSQNEFNTNRYKHRAILVCDSNGKIVGKISQLDVIRSLEPKYNDMISLEGLTRFGLSKKFMKSMLSQYELWEKPLNDICRKASKIKVSEIMYTPSEGEFVEENASLDEALHMLIMGHHQSLLVTRRGEIVGILRLTDIFTIVLEMMKECHTD